MDLLAQARAGDGEAFGQLVDPYRRELQVHCYRILGSAPLPLEYQGRELAGRFLAATAFRPGWTARLLATRANRQPAFGLYVRDSQTGAAHTVGLMVLTLSGNQVCTMTRFDPGTLPPFGLPLTIPD
jgi:hypothetical protein